MHESILDSWFSEKAEMNTQKVTYNKYMVYLDDGEDVYKVAIAAASEDAAKAQCAGNGEVIAIRDVTKDYPISLDKVSEALDRMEFGNYERDFICRALAELRIAE